MSLEDNNNNSGKNETRQEKDEESEAWCHPPAIVRRQHAKNDKQHSLNDAILNDLKCQGEELLQRQEYALALQKFTTALEHLPPTTTGPARRVAEFQLRYHCAQAHLKMKQYADAIQNAKYVEHFCILPQDNDDDDDDDDDDQSEGLVPFRRIPGIDPKAIEHAVAIKALAEFNTKQYQQAWQSYKVAKRVAQYRQKRTPLYDERIQTCQKRLRRRDKKRSVIAAKAQTIQQQVRQNKQQRILQQQQEELQKKASHKREYQRLAPTPPRKISQKKPRQNTTFSTTFVLVTPPKQKVNVDRETMEPASPALSYKLVPASPIKPVLDGTRRRSQRTRIKPMAFWRNERPIYQAETIGGPPVITAYMTASDDGEALERDHVK